MNSESIGLALRAQGLHVKEEWIQLQLQRRRSVASEKERGVVTQEIFRSAMFLDFHHIGQGCLPPNIDQLHNVYLKGPFIVQIDEMFNIAGTTEKRYSDGSGRMLKIFASDGCQNVRRLLYNIAVVCLEHQQISSLSIGSHAAGFKVCLINVYIRRGVLLLTSHNTTTLGGSAANMDNARQSLLKSSVDPVGPVTKTSGRPQGDAPNPRFAARNNDPLNQNQNSRQTSAILPSYKQPSADSRQQPHLQYQQPGTDSRYQQQPHQQPRQIPRQLPQPPPPPQQRQEMKIQVQSTYQAHSHPRTLPNNLESSSQQQSQVQGKGVLEQDFTAEEAFLHMSGSTKTEEELMEDVYQDEYEMIDSYIPTGIGNNQKFDYSSRLPKPAAQTEKALNELGEIVDMTEDETEAAGNKKGNAESSLSRYNLAPLSVPKRNIHAKMSASRSLESRLCTADVIKFDGMDTKGPNDVKDITSGISIVKPLPKPSPYDKIQTVDLSSSQADSIHNSPQSERVTPDDCGVMPHSPVKSSPKVHSAEIHSNQARNIRGEILHIKSQDKLVPSPPGSPTAMTCDSFELESSEHRRHIIAKKQRVFFNDILKYDDAEISRKCDEGFIEGRAISIKKFSVVEKKVAVPYFLTKLEFSDNIGIQDVKIKSTLCESFLKMSTQEYIRHRDNHVKSNNLDKKVGSNDYKKKIALTFGNFHGKFSIAYIDKEFVLQDFVRGPDLLQLEDS